jgi:hypothetical protein
MKLRHAAALALVGASSMAIVFVLTGHTCDLKAPPPIPTSWDKAGWCPEVPVSPTPPYYERSFGNWAANRKRCSNVDFKKDREKARMCGELCEAAQDAWNLKEEGCL